MRLLICVTLGLTAGCLEAVSVGGQCLSRQSFTGSVAKPALMLVVDKSGSMNFSADPSPSCDTFCGATACGNNGCKTRIGELKASMQSFLTTAGANAHFGLMPFPNTLASACQATTVSNISTLGLDLDDGGSDDPVALQATAAAVNARIQLLTPSGGTPTGPTLAALLDYPPLQLKTRVNYAVLLTDGHPNCNPDLDAVVTTCDCTFTKPAGQACSVAGLNQCLDTDGTQAQIAALKAKGITTIVVGFGAELASGMGAANDTLSKLATAGGFHRPCHTNADCGGSDTCSVTTTNACGGAMQACARSYFTAQNATDLTRALTDLDTAADCLDPCTVLLSRRASPTESLEVRFADQSFGADGGWVYVDDVAQPRVELVAGGAACSRMRAATPQQPVQVAVCDR